MYEDVMLYVAIGGQYILLFEIYTKINRLMWETRMCPYHQKLMTVKELVEAGDRCQNDVK